MEEVFPPIFLRDLSKLETDSKTGKLLFANKVSIDYLTIFGVIVDVEETSQGDWNIQIDDSSGIAAVLVSAHLANTSQVILEKGLFVVVSGCMMFSNSHPRFTVVASQVKTETEPIEELLVELEAMRYYKRHYYPALFPSSKKEQRPTADNTLATLEEILLAIRKNHGMKFSAIQHTFGSFSKEQLLHFLSKLMDDFSIYKHEDMYFPL
ncbi:hypothetical protein GAYE_HPESCF16G0226 [Galdieria yellowstonensis]|uniref:CST complex subunit Stn1 N-terminal domain-containing protein n=1 Tax=Galdieria yellowstonensis TaxID=3028027 RepID=A0AAV9I2G2_9RHOD|nr:hypothetical protein GAYE_HPESCF16G0226 [Galdieria yellowstonensis]